MILWHISRVKPADLTDFPQLEAVCSSYNRTDEKKSPSSHARFRSVRRMGVRPLQEPPAPNNATVCLLTLFLAIPSKEGIFHSVSPNAELFERNPSKWWRVDPAVWNRHTRYRMEGNRQSWGSKHDFCSLPIPNGPYARVSVRGLPPCGRISLADIMRCGRAPPTRKPTRPRRRLSWRQEGRWAPWD